MKKFNLIDNKDNETDILYLSDDLGIEERREKN